MLSVEEVEEHIREVVEMQKILNEASLKAELYAHHMEIEHADAIRAIVEANDREMVNERSKFDSVRYELGDKLPLVVITSSHKYAHTIFTPCTTLTPPTLPSYPHP